MVVNIKTGSSLIGYEMWNGFNWFGTLSNGGLRYCLWVTLRFNYYGTYLLTHTLHGGYYLKSPMSLSLSKNILISYGTRRFITVFTKACHWTLSWARRIQFAPSIPISSRSILMLSSHLRLGISSGLFPSGLPTKTLWTPRPPPCVPHAPPTSSSFS
jgi:hypothetical protein